MAKVKVKYFGEPRELLNIKEEEYEFKNETRLLDLILKHIPERHGKISERWRETIFRTVKGEITVNKSGTPLLKNYLILVGGKSQDLNYRLRDGDEILVLPPSGGG